MERLFRRSIAHRSAISGGIGITAAIAAFLIARASTPSYIACMAEFLRESDRNVAAAVEHMQSNYDWLLFQVAACACAVVLLAYCWFRLRSRRKRDHQRFVPDRAFFGRQK